MRRIVKFFSFSWLVLMGTMFLMLGPTAVVGITANLLNLPELIGLGLVINTFVVSVATALSEPYISFLEKKAEKI